MASHFSLLLVSGLRGRVCKKKGAHCIQLVMSHRVKFICVPSVNSKLICKSSCNTQRTLITGQVVHSSCNSFTLLLRKVAATTSDAIVKFSLSLFLCRWCDCQPLWASQDQPPSTSSSSCPCSCPPPPLNLYSTPHFFYLVPQTNTEIMRATHLPIPLHRSFIGCLLQSH